ncbi:MAG: PQQ-binding-like beta-propeller repeat protein [candidate division WOR-3 bacterium]|nr:PQQ-binding-like beta-propeller repeat protein [candidate division WOR-3 bacterium]
MLRNYVRPFLVLSAALALVAVSSCRKNHAPDVPDVPAGPQLCFKDTTYVFSVIATDPDGDSVAVRFDWGDSTTSDWKGWSPSGDMIALTHAWPDTGTYEVTAQVRDQKFLSSDWSGVRSVRVVLHPPNVPAVPIGPDTCFKGMTYTFTTVATHPAGDSVAVRFAWSDGDTSDWGPYVASGEPAAMSHAWSDTGAYKVTAQARDQKLLGSGWSGALSVCVVPRRPPNTPAAPTGPEEGGRDSSYVFTAAASHPDGITVAIRFAWGDGDTSDWSRYVASGEPVTDSHAWSVPDIYEIRAQAKDTGNVLSQWSFPHSIVIQPPDTMRKWRFRLAYGVDLVMNSSPAIGPDGTIYVGSPDDSLYAINSGGTLEWRYPTGGDVQSSPAIAADGTVYFGSYDYCLYAVNHDGTLKWRYPTGGHVVSSPAIAADGTVYFGSDDNYLYALNTDGTLRWSYPTARAVAASPAIGSDGTVYCGSDDNYFYAMDTGGTLKWRYQTGSDVRSSPAIAADGTIYVGSYDNFLYALNSDSTLKWRDSTGRNISSSPVIAADGTIYFGSQDNYVYALNPYGTLKWRYLTGSNIDASPAIGSDGTVYCGSDDNCLYALGPDGTLIWRYRTGAHVESSPTIGPDGTIYFVSDDGYLYALRGTGTLANSAWPKFHHDIKNTGRVGSVR